MKRKLTLKSLRILETLDQHFEFDERDQIHQKVFEEIARHLEATNNQQIEILANEWAHTEFEDESIHHSIAKPNLTALRELAPELFGFKALNPKSIKALDWMKLGALFALAMEVEEKPPPTKEEELAYQHWKKSMDRKVDLPADEINAYLKSENFVNNPSSFNTKCNRWKKEWRTRYKREQVK